MGQSVCSIERRIDVAVGFSVYTKTDLSADEIGRELVGRLLYAGNPNRAPREVVFLRATEVAEPTSRGQS